MKNENHACIAAYVKNQLDLHMLQGMSSYFRDEGEWLGDFQYDLLWQMFKTMQKATEEMGLYCAGENYNKEQLDHRLEEMLETIFQVITPLMDIMMGMETEIEYNDLISHFPWLGSLEGWSKHKVICSEENSYKRRIKPLLEEKEADMELGASAMKIQKTIEELQRSRSRLLITI